jgi:hypothetical protein
MQIDRAASIHPDREAQDVAVVRSITDRITIWLKRIIFLEVLIALPLIYRNEYVGREWLNRTGLIFTFLSGFLITPELLGMPRLRKAETLIEDYSQQAIRILERTVEPISEQLPKNNIGKIFTAFVGFIFLFSSASLIIIYTYDIKKTLLFIGMIFAVQCGMCLFVTFLDERGERYKTLFESMMAFGTFILFQIVIVLSPLIIVLVAIYYLIKMTIMIPSEIMRALTGEDRLPSILVYWGIILFIIGNALQFIASF